MLEKGAAMVRRYASLLPQVADELPYVRINDSLREEPD